MRSFVPGRFAVIRTLREDRFSKTFLANDHLLGQENVIVRIVQKDYIQTNRDQLIEHFSWVIGVQHGLFATVLDAGLTKRQDLYYVREFLPSSELFSTDISSWIQFVVSAIDFLSQHNRIHGGLKPSNIFLADKLFKIADARSNRLKFTEGEESIHFTAPEILRGAPVSHAGDLYSMGAVMYRALTGRHLFEDSDFNRLRSKYLSASPQPTPILSTVSHSIAQLTLQLLSKNPTERLEAFERLKRTVTLEDFAPQRSAFVGRERELEQAIELVQKPTSLRILSVEGEIGIGKTRFLEEIRLHCAFRGYTFALWQCKQNSVDLAPIAEGLQRLIPSDTNRLPKLTLDRSRAQATTCSNAVEHPPEKTISEMISALASFAMDRPTVIAIDDLNLANTETVTFLKQVAFRASDLPLTLLFAARPVEVEPDWVKTLSHCTGTDFHSVRLSSLSEEQSRALVKFLEADPEREATVLKLAAGNPLLISAYTRSEQPLELKTRSASEAATVLLSGLSKDTRRLLEVLSVIQKPLRIDLLRSLCSTSAPNLEHQLATAIRLGIVRCDGNTAEIQLPIVRNRLFESLSRRTKVSTSRMVFTLLREVECDIGVLAEYAFQGRLFNEASLLYAGLADRAYKLQEYNKALAYYERLRHCRKILGAVLTAIEVLNAAVCYDKTGRQRSSSRLYKELLGIESVQADPSLLSLVYTRLAKATNESAVKERARYLELGIECLPKDSSHINRYSLICQILVLLGDLRTAKTLFSKMQEYVLRDKVDPTALDVSHAGILLNTCDLRRSLEYYRRSMQLQPNNMALLVNVGLCHELLGELDTALDCYSHAQTNALTAGDIPAQLLSLNNVAAIKTKLGQTREAARLYKQSLNGLRNLSTRNKVEKARSFATVEADIALNAIHQGNYAMANECLNSLRVPYTSIGLIDWMLCQTTRCKFLTEIGLTNKARRAVTKWFDFDDHTNGFAQTERALLEARFPEIPAPARLDGLNRALKHSHNLGTLYQQCEVLISLGAVYLEIDKKQNARDHLREALESANKNNYRLLAARALMVSGIVAEDPVEKQQFLSEAFQQASEMGLQELVAESAYQIGVLNLEAGNVMTAREYLIRSTSITARLADGVPTTARSKYLSKQWRRDALRALDRCNEAIPVDTTSMFNTEGEKYFAGAYSFTMAAAAATSFDRLIVSIEKTITDCFRRSAVITIRSANESCTVPIRIKITPELSNRIQLIRSHARNRVYFDSADEKGKQPIGWIPMKSETYEGGIYLAYRPHETPFTEKEIELLTMMGTIASSALKRLETRQAYEEEPRDTFEFHGILGASKPIKEVYSQIQMAAGNTANVLIEGESGTGKELVAKAIHAAGSRAKEAFVAIDCGTLPEGLIEAELFGAKRGSYTGAIADRSGLFEAAHKGTLFLDEISNTTPGLQAKLLRVIQERKVRRIGETKDHPIDVRLIVASNRSLESLTAAGQFRKDLLYRLKVLHVQMPALRDRCDDIPMLAHAFLQRLNTANKTRKCFATGVVDHLSTQSFPGNVRELQNLIERAFFLAKGIVITEIPVETPVKGAAPIDEVQTLFHDIKEGRKDFWSDIHNRYKRRDISREKVLAFVDFGLRSTRGSYTTMASMFRLKETDYRRFMDFLRRNDCLLDFRPYRKAPSAS